MTERETGRHSLYVIRKQDRERELSSNRSCLYSHAAMTSAKTIQISRQNVRIITVPDFILAVYTDVQLYVTHNMCAHQTHLLLFIYFQIITLLYSYVLFSAIAIKHLPNIISFVMFSYDKKCHMAKQFYCPDQSLGIESRERHIIFILLKGLSTQGPLYIYTI